VRLSDLTPIEAERVAALLDEALDLEQFGFTRWRAELARREPELCPVVARLATSITAPNSDRAETGALIARGVARAAPLQAAVEGRKFGPYRVLRLLGRGGMGSVWLADRDDGLFDRQVALKLVNACAGGRAFAERFARERRILSALEHPHIARLLDAGISDDGQPFLAIEYVEGAPLDTYCDTHCLSVRARIGLMLQVLSAVQYAHQNLVIHRDLKPANILVTHDGHVRLLDFGVAKLLTDGEALETELTQLDGRALTPDYASPEQIAGRQMSAASDVYALGVLLYRLLCGHRPYQLPRASRGALEEAILATSPVRPSQCAITDSGAQARSTTARKLVQTLAGDLDTIVSKALKKDPVERYTTAAAFAQDLQRYLDGEPVLARPDSAIYRFRKFVGRNRGKVGVAVAAAALLMIAAGVSIRQAQVAQREAQHAQAVQRFLLNIFKTNSNQQPDPIRARQTTARELLDVGAKQAVESLRGAPRAQDEVLETLADMYAQLGLREEAAQMRQLRIDAMKQAYGARDVRVANALLAYAEDVASTRQRERVPAALEEATAILDANGDYSSSERGWVWITAANWHQYQAIGPMRVNAQRAVQHFERHPSGWSLFHALQAAARARYWVGDYEGAVAGHRDAIAEAQRRHPAPSAWLITPWVQLAEAQTTALKLDEAESHLRQALSLSRAINGDLNGVTLQTQAKLGGFLHAMGRREEGTRLLRNALEAIGKPGANATPNAVGAVHRNLGAAFLDEGRMAEAEPHLAAEVADLRQHYPDSIPLARMLLLQGRWLTAVGRYKQSTAALDEARRIWQRAGGDAVEPFTMNRYLLEQTQLLLAQGDAAAAVEKLRAVVSPAHADALPLRLEQTQAQIALARAYLQQDRFNESMDQARQALAHIEGSPLRERFQWLEADAALSLGLALRNSGDAKTARGHFERALQLRRAHSAERSPWIADAEIALAACLLDLGESKSARNLLDQARATHAAHTELGEHFVTPLQRVMRRLVAQ